MIRKVVSLVVFLPLGVLLIVLAVANRGDDPFGYRVEAVNLMRLAQSLSR